MKIQIKESELLPIHYTKAKEPYFEGEGVYSVSRLEEICEQYKELVHQLRIREQTILNKLNAEIIK